MARGGSQVPIWARDAAPDAEPDAAHVRDGPVLSRERIVTRAIAIADADGLAAVSMRKIAADLGCGTMSLYRHVPTKKDLLDLMLDTAMGNAMSDAIAAGVPPEAIPGTGLRERLATIGRGHRAMLREHPWLSQVMATRASFGPNLIRIADLALSAFDDLDVDPDTAMAAIGAINSFVSGFVTEELGAEEARRRTGLSEAEWRKQMAPYMFALFADGQNRRIARFVYDGDNAFEMDAERQFTAQLGFVLDGIVARVERESATRSAAGEDVSGSS